MKYLLDINKTYFFLRCCGYVLQPKKKKKKRPTKQKIPSKTNKQTNKYERNPYPVIFTYKRELIKTGICLDSYEPAIPSAILV